MTNRQLTDSSTRLRARLREETASMILSAAERAIAEEGLQSARIERIAAYAGVSVGTIYNHFKDRTALVQALFDSRGFRMADQFEKALAATADAPAREQVRALFLAVVEHGRQHGQLFSALVRENHGPSRIRAPAVSRTAFTMSAAALVSRAIATGEFREDPSHVFPEALVGLLRQALACAVEGRGTPEEIESMTDLFIRGVAR
jgi:AcrR family transcriptional regulator